MAQRVGGLSNTLNCGLHSSTKFLCIAINDKNSHFLLVASHFFSESRQMHSMDLHAVLLAIFCNHVIPHVASTTAKLARLLSPDSFSCR